MVEIYNNRNRILTFRTIAKGKEVAKCSATSFAVNFVEHFAAGKRKEAANACNLFLSEWAQRGMIPRPSDYESAALTD